MKEKSVYEKTADGVGCLILVVVAYSALMFLLTVGLGGSVMEFFSLIQAQITSVVETFWGWKTIVFTPMVVALILVTFRIAKGK